METILFLADSILVALMCYMVMRDERRPRGAPATSLFRFVDDAADVPAPGAAAPARRGPFQPGSYYGGAGAAGKEPRR